MDRLLTLEMFVAVASEGGFAAAARKIGSSPPAVTRGIAALEARLHVLPVVGELLARHDALAVRMMLIDRNVRIVEEGIDIALRIGPLADSSLKAVRIGTVRQMLVASPGYLARRGAPATIDALADHDLIISTGPRAAGEWNFAERRWRVEPRPRLVVNTVDAAMAAAEAGIGIANLLSYQVMDGVDAGRLIALLNAEQPPPLPVHLVFEQSRAGLPAVRLLIEAMRRRMRAAGLG
jgi:DNA-binding transcriptional LysR family regulator